jgi:phosphate transport system permease protein
MVDVSKRLTVNGPAADAKAIIKRHKLFDSLFAVLGVVALSIALLTLSALVIKLGMDGIERISLEFFTSFPSRFAEKAGILSAWVGTLLVMLVTSFTATIIGVAAGIYLEEYAPKNWFSELIEINISNLAGVPSIVYGLLALGLFVYQFKLGTSILTAGLTLALLVLPIVIVSTREAIRAVPRSIHEASYALGATKWQTMQDHILPYSLGGILTGIIIALSRAIGETAPLITIGALTFIAFLPEPPLSATFPFISFQWLMSPFTVMPIQMFNWTSRPQEAFQTNAAAAGIVLLVMTLSINALAIYLRASFRKRIKW